MAVLGFVALLALKIRPANVLSDVLHAWLFIGLTFLVHWFINSQYLVSNDDMFIHYFNFDQGLVALSFTFRLVLILAVMSSMSRLHEMQRYGKSIGRIFARSPIGKRLLSQIELIATLAFRMITFIQNQYARLGLALEARGENFSAKTFGKLLKLKRLLYPLMVQAIRRADRTAIALQARGYDPAVARTYFKTSRIEFRSYALATLFSLVSLVIIWI